MKNIPKAPKLSTPVLFDAVIGQIQDRLISDLLWLDYAFGRAQSLVREKDGRDYKYPAVYIRNNEYQSVEPNPYLGDFCFFLLDDRQVVNFNPNSYNSVGTDYILVFWFSLDSVFGTSAERNIEMLKASILGSLTRNLRLSSGSLTVESIEESDIFREYSLSEVDSQYLMHPYAGFRFTGRLVTKEVC